MFAFADFITVLCTGAAACFLAASLAICASIASSSTFSNSKVKSLLKDFVLLRVDLTDNTKANQMLQDKLDVIAPPTILFFNPNKGETSQKEHFKVMANEEKSLRVVGEMGPEDFMKRLETLKQG